MIRVLYKRRKPNVGDPEAEHLADMLRKSGFPNITRIRIEHVLRTEGIGRRELARLAPLFGNPVVEDVRDHTWMDWPHGTIVEIAYQRAVTDQEMPSIMHVARSLGIEGLTWARLAARYQFSGIHEGAVDDIVAAFLCNPTVQAMVPKASRWATLAPQGASGGVELFNIAGMAMAELRGLSEARRLFLSAQQLAVIQSFYLREGRPARDSELEMVAAAWSDHCSHTTMRSLGLFQLLKETTRRLNHPLVVSAYADNSGVMKFYGGWALCIKGETHISPSSIATYGGIMTKHGGVIRDIIFTGHGGWPWAGTTVMATCDPRMPAEEVPEGALHPRVILLESIRGTADYTNPMGIPMGWSEYLVHPHNVKCFALGHSVGIIPIAQAHKGKPRPGDVCVLIGGPTGMDGLHGATVSSGAMTAHTATVDAAHVQIGHPIEERKFMEAIPVLRDADCVRACTDCGAAGLSSAVGEMAEGVGVAVNLAWVPLKCAAMLPWQIWLSESQERGVLCVPRARLNEALAILDQYDVPSAVIGFFTDTNRCQVLYNGAVTWHDWADSIGRAFQGSEVVVDLSYEFLAEEAPLPEIPVRRPEFRNKPFVPWRPETSGEWLSYTLRAFGHWHLADQSAAAHQYDQTVQGSTVVPYVGGPAENMLDDVFCATPVRGKPWGAAIANAVNQFYAEVDPEAAGWHIVAQAVSRLVAAGFSPNDIVFNANLYTPRVTDNPEAAWRLQQLVRGYNRAQEVFRIPLVSGKDSSSGTYVTVSVRIDAPLTLEALAMGRMPAARRLIRKPFITPGDTIRVFTPGLASASLGGSVYADLHGARGDALPDINLEELRAGWNAYHAVACRGIIRSRSAIGTGGLLNRLFQMCLGSHRLGCTIDLGECDPLLWLFGEFSGGIVFAAEPGRELPELAGAVQVTGTVTDSYTIVVTTRSGPLFRVGISEIASNGWAKTFKEVAL